MSRARERERIPEVIREMREEYGGARDKLWALMERMWDADLVDEQVKCLRQLEEASHAVFAAAFERKIDVLSLSLKMFPPTLPALSSAGKEVYDAKKPRLRVAAVSFARKLAGDLREQLCNSRHVLQRHLTGSELRAFGA
ncbi:MAG: hypothetical protein OXH52_06760 [Gammaproteobacteria bacterium]|nr:hypothetical protein [Gammaproteobacteria bacterium]